MEDVNNFPPELLEVKTARGNKQIYTSDILYIKGSQKHSLIFFVNSVQLEVHSMLKWFAGKLPEPTYCRCHDSYIVNFQHCDCTNGNNFVLNNNGFVPIAATKKASSILMLREFLLRQKGRNSGDDRS